MTLIYPQCRCNKKRNLRVEIESNKKKRGIEPLQKIRVSNKNRGSVTENAKSSCSTNQVIEEVLGGEFGNSPTAVVVPEFGTLGQEVGHNAGREIAHVDFTRLQQIPHNGQRVSGQEFGSDGGNLGQVVDEAEDLGFHLVKKRIEMRTRWRGSENQAIF